MHIHTQHVHYYKLRQGWIQAPLFMPPPPPLLTCSICCWAEQGQRVSFAAAAVPPLRAPEVGPNFRR
ncbi:hypothetical protein FKM82_002501 [Ascaphus truei]